MNRPSGDAASWDELTLTKLARLVGDARAREIHAECLGRLNLATLATPDDLFAFGAELARYEGFVATLGGLLRVKAVLSGAAGR